MLHLKLVFMALLPVAILGYYIYHKDRYCPEPLKELAKALLLGVVSCFASLLISRPLGALGFYSDEIYTALDAVRLSLFGAALPEELAKLAMLWLMLRRSRHFDQTLDGIVYAVFISLGFAGLENIMYLASNVHDYVSVGVMRGIFSVPGHFCFGVLMGYYYSLARFYGHNRRRNLCLALLVPVLVHAAYDAILFTASISDVGGLLFVILFIWFCHKLWKRASHSIAEHIERDKER